MNDIKFTNKNINKTNFANIDIAASLKCHSPMNNVINLSPVIYVLSHDPA